MSCIFEDGMELLENFTDAIKSADIKTLIHLMGILTVCLWSYVIGNGVVNFKLFIKSSCLMKASTFIMFLFLLRCHLLQTEEIDYIFVAMNHNIVLVF